MTEKDFDYVINLDVKFNPFEKIDIHQMVAENKEKWFNQTLTKVNDSVVRMAIIEGEFHWHKHDNDDEFFYVIDGKLLVDLEDRTIELNPGQGVTIPKTVLHRTRAPQKNSYTDGRNGRCCPYRRLALYIMLY